MTVIGMKSNFDLLTLTNAAAAETAIATEKGRHTQTDRQTERETTHTFPLPGNHKLIPHIHINVVFAFATFAKRFFGLTIVHKAKCLTLALFRSLSLSLCLSWSLSPSLGPVIYPNPNPNPSLASRSRFCCRFILFSAPSCCFCHFCCHKKLIRIVNFVFIRQQTGLSGKTDSRLKIKIFITTRRHLSVCPGLKIGPFR